MSDSEQSPAYTVSQAMQAAKYSLEKIRITVIGEVSEFKISNANHAFFSIKDEKSVMSCVMWDSLYQASGTKLEVGMQVEIAGNLSCFTAKGTMQFYAKKLAPVGEGRLRVQVAQLAKKLEAEGLMDPARKRPIPRLPKRIAIVTSPRGKAVHDVIRTLRKRYPLAELYMCGVTVEGTSAPQNIIAGLQAAWNAPVPPDVILLVRGGGSYEDLMPFNDEALARAVASSPIPIITGIGHEPDNSICDMVGDVRCSTPTAAAEAAAMSKEELQGKVKNARNALRSSLLSYVQSQATRLEGLRSHPMWRDPYYLTSQSMQMLDILGDRLTRAIPDALSKDAHVLASLRDRLLIVGPRLCSEQQKAIALEAAKLDALSPLKTLSRGYSIAYGADGHSVIDSVSGVQIGDAIKVQVQDGMLACTVDQVEGVTHG